MNIMLRNGNLSGLSSIESEMNRMMREFLSPSLFMKENQDISPAIELSDDKENIYLKAELPGVDRENVDIQVSEDYVSISGEYNNKKECKSEEGRIYRCELKQGSFIRTVPLPEAVNHQNARAEFENGLLKLTIPKLEEKERGNTTKVKL